MAVTGMHLGGELVQALGLPSETTDILITIGLDEPIAILCRYYPNEEALRAAMAVLAQYQLVTAEEETGDAFTSEQRRRLFRQNLLRGELGVESPYLKRYLARKAEADALIALLMEISPEIETTVLTDRLAKVQALISRMEAGEAV